MLSAGGTKYLDETMYHDGLGRPRLQVQEDITPLGRNLLTLHAYDGAGRDSASWLPVESASAWLEPAAVCQQSADAHGDIRPYSLAAYEAYCADVGAYAQAKFQEVFHPFQPEEPGREVPQL